MGSVGMCGLNMWETVDSISGLWITIATTCTRTRTCVHTHTCMHTHTRVCVYYCCSVVKLCPTLCDAMDYSMQDLPALHCLLEFAQTQVGDYHPIVSSSVVPFSSCPQSFLASGSFSSESVLHIRWPAIGASALTSVLPMNIQG